MSDGLNLNLKIWRQRGPESKGEFEDYELENVSPDMSFLEMLDVLNSQLEAYRFPESDCYRISRIPPRFLLTQNRRTDTIN